MLSAKEQRLLEQIEGAISEDDVEVVTIELLGAKRAPILRVYIDTPAGVTFDVLSKAQAKIGDMLDEIDPFPGAYTLEVSSPGIDRPLRTPEHFKRYVGSKAQVKCAETIDGRGRFKGEIVEASETSVSIECDDGKKYDIPLERISRANLIGEVDFG